MATKAEPSELQGHMTLMEHIAELRTRLVRSVIAVAIGAVIAWFLYDPLLHFLLGPLRQLSPDEDLANRLLTTDPLEPFAVRIKITTYAGIMLAMPVILWQIWGFVSPGLYSNEKRYARWFVACGTALFFLGAAIAFWTVPKALEFLETIGGEENFNQFYAPGKYLRLITYMMLAFGIGFEFPILLVFLQIAGIVDGGAAPPVPPLRHRRPGRHRRRRHPERRPDQHAGAAHPDDPLLRSRHRVRAHPRTAPAQGGGQGLTEIDFTLDRFQVEAIEAIDAGQSVLVAAPTGVGQDGRGRARGRAAPPTQGRRPSTRRRSRRSRTRSSPTWWPSTGPSGWVCSPATTP